MKAALPPYPAYKDSGIPWLGNVPEHWIVIPNRTIFDEVKDRNHPYEDMLSVTITNGILPQEALLSDTSKKDSSNQDKSAYKLVQPGDLAYNKMRAWQGAIGISDFRGIISPAYVVMRLRGGHSSRYFHYLFRIPQFAKEAESWSYGITSDMWSLRPEHFKLIYSSAPPLDEQTAIVKFLDYMDRQIRRYVGAKKKLIKLLEEQKQAIIHRAVTRGLDPDVRLKPSGVEWLGDVPEHWEVERLKYLAKMNPSRTEIDGFASNTVVTVLPMEHVSEWGQIDSSRTSELGSVNSGFTYMREGDVIIAKITPCFENGKGAVCTGLANRIAFGSTEFHVLRPGARVLPWYLYYLTRDETFRVHGSFNMRGSAGQQRVPTEFLASWYMPIPPVTEQRDIVTSINQELHELNDAAERLHREIALLGEYRTRLIADVVTGKLDVREAAARLPDEQIESELVDDENAPVLDDEFEDSDPDLDPDLDTELEEVEA